jgi:L-ornithine Nalpha-acyltransferase
MMPEHAAVFRLMADLRQFELRLANSGRDLQAAQRLRYKVFVEELKGNGPGVDHALRLEADRFDIGCDHLLLIDRHRDAAALDDVVGVYRLLRGDRVMAAGGAASGFYSASEYDLSPLLASGRRLLELGRSCVDPDHRGGTALFHLWSGLADYVSRHGIEVVFGVASFHGTDLAALAEPLAYLFHNHLAPDAMRVRAIGPNRAEMNLMAPGAADRRRAMLAMPPLIKAYIRLGGFVGDGAYVDAAFNTTDVCFILDTALMSERLKALYSRQTASMA